MTRRQFGNLASVVLPFTLVRAEIGIETLKKKDTPKLYLTRVYYKCLALFQTSQYHFIDLMTGHLYAKVTKFNICEKPLCHHGHRIGFKPDEGQNKLLWTRGVLFTTWMSWILIIMWQNGERLVPSALSIENWIFCTFLLFDGRTIFTGFCMFEVVLGFLASL